MNKTELLSLLQSTRMETLSYFELPEEQIAKNYGERKWSVKEILHHLTDTEMMLLERIKRVIATPAKQVVWAVNPDTWNHAFNYANEPLTGKKEVYNLVRDINYRLTDQYYDAYKQKEFVHSETGLRTLADEFTKVALHNQNHNDHIKLALGL